MTKTIVITGSTDGIGRVAARKLVSDGHHVLIHGRNPAKLEAVERELAELPGAGKVESFRADLSKLAEVEGLAREVRGRHAQLDVLINNAGVFKVRERRTADGLDLTFAVNTVAPYLLTQRLLPLLGAGGRVVNLSSAAQAPVDVRAFDGSVALSESAAYAQSKLAITMWSRHLAQSLAAGPAIIALNPGSMLATKMVKQAYGVQGASIDIGANIIVRAALSEEFAQASGQYFDNDARRFGSPHPHALDAQRCEGVVRAIEAILARVL